MKENILDVLMYLFENYMEPDAALQRQTSEIVKSLQEDGFSPQEIAPALQWLDDLSTMQSNVNRWSDQLQLASRVYTYDETIKLPTETRGFIHSLEKLSILSPITRELVIDRAMALDEPVVDIARLKWVILMVLSNTPGQEAQLAWMEDYVLNNREKNH